jgi:hypothetical protein
MGNSSSSLSLWDIEQPIQSQPWDEATWMEHLRLTAVLFGLDGWRLPR